MPADTFNKIRRCSRFFSQHRMPCTTSSSTLWSSSLSHLSRSEFLKSSGIAVLAGTVGRLSLMLPSAPQIEALYGRALSVLTVYDSPSPSAVVINRLFPDSVVPIIDTLSDWYQLANGYAKRSDIQPMMLTNHTVPTPQLPFWAEVGGAVAIVRGWCAADAPLVARIV